MLILHKEVFYLQMTNNRHVKLILGLLGIALVIYVFASAISYYPSYSKKSGKAREQLIIENIESAKELLPKVNILSDKAGISNILDNTKSSLEVKQMHVKAYDALVKAMETKTQKNINEARFLILVLPNSINNIKIDLSNKLDNVQNELIKNAFDAAVYAEGTGKKQDYNKALELYNELLTVQYNEGLLQWVQITLKAEIDKVQVKQ